MGSNLYMAPFLEVVVIPMASLIIGAILGEILAYKTFGVPKNSFVLIFDMLFFVFLISAIFTYLKFTTFDMVYYMTNFIAGFISIPIIRGTETAFGLTHTPYLNKKGTIEIIQSLSRAGMDKDEIVQSLKRIGYSTKDIEKYFEFITRSVSPYLPKIVRMEEKLESIEKKLEVIGQKKPRRKK